MILIVTAGSWGPFKASAPVLSLRRLVTTTRSKSMALKAPSNILD